MNNLYSFLALTNASSVKRLSNLLSQSNVLSAGYKRIRPWCSQIIFYAYHSWKCCNLPLTNINKINSESVICIRTNLMQFIFVNKLLESYRTCVDFRLEKITYLDILTFQLPLHIRKLGDKMFSLSFYSFLLRLLNIYIVFKFSPHFTKISCNEIAYFINENIKRMSCSGLVLK